MKIERIEDLHCDAGWRTFSFLKITTADGIVGWSEYTEADGSRGLTAIIRGLAEALIGADPRQVQRITSSLHNRTIQAPGGVNQRAIAAIENALLDIKAKALGVPVYEMLGGAVRDRIPVYWSHCGTYRVRNHELLGVPALRTYDDLARLGEEVRHRGFKALKTNILPSDGERLISFAPGFGRTPGHPALNIDRNILDAVRSTLRAFRDGAGPDMGLHLDVNYHFKTEGNLKVAKAVEPFDLAWLEIDTWDAASLALIRRAAPCPIASCESLTGRRGFRPFLDAYAMDVAIVDVIWNGFLEVAEDRRDDRAVRGQRGAAQLLRPPVLDDRRAFLRGGAELPHHGDRHRQRALARRTGDAPARVRGRRDAVADPSRVGHRHRRGRRARASAKAVGEPLA